MRQLWNTDRGHAQARQRRNAKMVYGDGDLLTTHVDRTRTARRVVQSPAVEEERRGGKKDEHTFSFSNWLYLEFFVQVSLYQARLAGR